ncbi:MAG: hypothetical protein KBT07_06075 [Clostridiales bacterium]|nr:hypothetical protein [Candidatus Scatonaster coprocaballi]
MKFEPTENDERRDTSVQFSLRASMIPIFIDFFLCIVLVFLMLYFHQHNRFHYLIRLLAIGLSPLALCAFFLAMIDWRSTLVLVTKYRVYGQHFKLRPSSRQIEFSLEEIQDLEIRATLGTRFFKYAHLIIYPEHGKRVTLRHIYYAEERATRIFELQSQMRRKAAPET